jgi:hypothetical protein
MIVGVDFDQDWQGVAPFGAPRCDQAGHLDVVEYDRQPGPTSPQVEYVLQLVRRDTDGIKQIGEAMIEEILCFSERRDRQWPGWTARDKARNLGALRGFDVGPKPDSERYEMGL